MIFVHKLYQDQQRQTLFESHDHGYQSRNWLININRDIRTYSQMNHHLIVPKMMKFKLNECINNVKFYCNIIISILNFKKIM